MKYRTKTKQKKRQEKLKKINKKQETKDERKLKKKNPAYRSPPNLCHLPLGIIHNL